MTIPDEVILHPQLTPLCVYFYLKILTIAGGIGKPLRIKTSQIGFTRQAISKYCYLLEKYGYLAVQHSRGPGQSNCYTVLK